MNRTELRALMLEKIASFYENVPDDYLPIEYQIGVSIAQKDVVVVESYEDVPDDYTYIVLVDLYESTVTDAVEYALRQGR